MSTLNKKTRVAGGNGALAAEETNLNKLRRLVSLAIITNENFSKTNINVISDIISLASRISENEYSEFISIITYARLEIGIRSSVIAAIVGAIEGGHTVILDMLEPKIFLRPTDIMDLISLYLSRGNKKTLPRKLKRLISKSLNKYDSYQFSKYGRSFGNDVNLVDVFNLVHPVPENEESKINFKNVVEQTLPVAYTWESVLSSGKFKSKKEAWLDLINSGRLPSLSTIRNVRNILESGIENTELAKMIRNKVYINRIFPDQVLKAYTSIEDSLVKEALLNKLVISDRNSTLKGKSLFILDISGSMGTFDLDQLNQLSGKAFSVLYSLIQNAENFEVVITAGDDYKRLGKSEFLDLSKVKNIEDLMSEIQQISKRIGWGGIFTKQCLDWVAKEREGVVYDRVVVISDSQDCDRNLTTKDLPSLGKYNYINNIAGYGHVAYTSFSTNNFEEIVTFSTKIVDFIKFHEKDFKND